MGANIFDTLRQEQGDSPQRQITIFDQLRETGEREAEIKANPGQQKTAVTQAISQPTQERTVGDSVKDVGVSLAGGVADLAKAGAGLGNLASFGLAGKVHDAMGYNPKAISEKIDSWYSKPQQEANKKVEEAEGFIGTAKAMIDNPSTIGHGVVETVPMMLAGGLIARGALGVLGRVAPGLAKKTAVKLSASALGEGSLQSGSMFEDVRQQTGSVDTKKAAMSIASGFGTGAFNILGGSLSRKLGFVDVDSLLAGIQKETGKKVTSGMVTKAIVQGGISEGVFEERPQSAQETMWMNAATGQPIMQGVDKALAQGGIIGGAMGGGVNAASMSKKAMSSQGEDSDALKQNEAALKLQDQNLSTDDLRNIRDNQELQEEQGVDRDLVIGMLADRVRDTAQAATILENEPNPGPLTKAGKIGVKQEWAKHILDQQAQRNFDEKPVDIDVGGQRDPDIDAADQLATALTSVEIDSEQDRAERAGYAQQFLDDDQVSDEAKEHFWNTGVPEHLGLKKPGTETEGPRQKEWEAQEEKSLKFNQIKNKKPAEISPEEKAFMEEYEKGNESTSEYPGGPPAAVEQVPDKEVKKHEAKVRQEREDWQKDNKRAAFQKKLAELQEETDNQEEVDTGVLVMADPGIKKQAEKDAEKIVRENPVYQQKNEIKKNGGLDIHQAKETWDESTISGLVKRYPGLFTAQVVNGPKPMEIDTTASELGYESADAMIQAFADAPTIKSETSRLVQQYEQEWAAAEEAQAEDESLSQLVHSPVTEQSPEDFKILLDGVKAKPEDYSEEDFDVSSVSDEQRRTLVAKLNQSRVEVKTKASKSVDDQKKGNVKDKPVPKELTEDRLDNLSFTIKQEINRRHPDGDPYTLKVPVDDIPKRILDIANRIFDDNKQNVTPEETAEYDAFIDEKSVPENVDKISPTTISDKTKEIKETSNRGAGVILAEDGRAYVLEDLAASIYRAGQSLAEFTKKLKEKLGNAFEQIKDQVKALYDGLNAHLDTFTTGAEDGALVFYKDLSKAQRKEVKKNLDSHTDGKRIAKNLEEHNGTSWEKAAVDTILVRQGIEDLLAGKSPKVESSINAPSTKTTRDIILKKGEQGIWDILNSRKFIGTAEKPGFIVSASYSHCDPSRDCAQFCYATRGRNYAATQVKNELISWAVEKDPVRAANRAAVQYKATTEFEAGKALRLFERGDMTEPWVPFIKQMNKRGVRVHVFSKRPELLRQISDKNVRMLSIDNSNFEMADKNPDLPIALVYRGKQDLQFATDHAEQIGVVLPIVEGRRHLNRKELAGLPTKVRRRLCPVDAGVKSIKNGWKCTKCDVLGGIGCYKGISANSLQGIEEPLYNRDIGNRINKIRKIAKELPDGSRQDLYAELDLLLSQVRRGVDPGEAGQGFTEIQAGNRIPDWRGKNKESAYESSTGYSTVSNGENSYEVPTHRATTVYRDSKLATGVSESTPTQTTIFGPEKGNRPGSTRSRKKFLEAHPAKIGTFKFDLDRIESVEDAAQVLSPIGMRAQETFMALVLDAGKQPIAVIQHSVGGPRSNQIFIPEFIGSIHNLKGADSVWIAHNHPSSNLTESPQDTDLTLKLQNAIRDTGVDLLGHLIITPEGKAAALDADGKKKRSNFTIVQPSRKDRSVKVTERRLKGDFPELLSETPVLNSAEAKAVMDEYAKGQNGILLLNSQHQPIVFIPASLADMKKLRNGKGRLAANLYRILDKKNNAVVAMLNFSGDSASHKVAEENMAKFTNAIGVGLLDSFMKGESRTDAGILPGIKSSAGDTFYSISNEILPKKEQSPVRRELESKLGQPGVTRLINKGHLEIVSPKRAEKIWSLVDGVGWQNPKDGRIEGFTKGGKVYLVEGNIRKGDAMTVLSHELGVHSKNLGFRDTKQFKAILKMLEQRSTANTAEGRAIREAQERIPSETKPEHRQEEMLAYLISNSPEIGIVRRLFAQLKKFLVENFGITPEILNNIDMQALALSVVKGEAATDKDYKQRSNVTNDVAMASVSKKEENQIIRNTKNLNSEKNGVTSDSSLSHGEKIVAEIIRKLAATSSPAVAADRFGSKALTESIKAYRLAAEIINDPHKSIAEKQKFAASFAKKLPPAPRAKLLQRLSAISRMKTEAAQQKRLDDFLAQADKVLTDHLKRELLSSVKRNSAKFKTKKDKVARGRGHVLERDLAYIRDVAFDLESPDAIIAEEARLEALSASLELRLESTKTKKGRARIQDKIDDAQSRWNLLRIFGGIERQGFDSLVNARAVLQQTVTDGRAEWRTVQEMWRKRHQQNRAKAAEEITGSDDPTPEQADEEQRRIEKEKSAAGRVKETLSAITNSIQSWELSMDRIAGKSGNKTLQSWLVRHFGSIAHKATRDYERMQMETNNMIMAKAAEIFKVKPGAQLAKVFAKLNQAETGKIFFYNEDGERQQATMSPLQAAYWYQISRDKGNEAMEETFLQMGVTDKTLHQIERFMGKDLKKWADYLVDEFYQDFHDDTNEIYRQVYGIDLAKNKNYVPWKRKKKGKVADRGHEGFLAGMNSGTIKKGSLRERVSNALPFRTANLNDVLMQHVSDMNHFKAWAIPTKEINGTFNDAEVQGYIRQHYGVSTLKEIRRFQDHFVRSESEIMDDMQWLDRWRGKITTAMIGANPTVFLKQLSSIPAYAADIPVGDWVKYTALAMANPVKAAMILGESTMMKARYKKGFERDVANAMRRGGNDLVAQSRRITDRLMVLTSLGDRIAITLGGYAVYRHHLKQNKKAGMGKNQAHQDALTKFEMATERSQQSGNVKDLGGFQRGTPLMKLFTMYMTAPASYSRQIFTAIRHAKDSPADSAKRLFIYGVVLPSLFQAVTDAFMIFGGDDEDEERFWKNQAKALALGSFNGLPVIRTMMEGYANTIAGNNFYEDQYTPVMQAFATSKDMVGNTVKWSEGGTSQINGDEYLMRALWDATQLGGYATGVPVRPIAKITGGMKDAVSGETEHPIRRSLGYSSYIVGEK